MSIEKCFPGKKIGTTNYGEKQKSALQAYAEAWDEYVGLMERKSMHNGSNDSPGFRGNREVVDAARKDGVCWNHPY